MRPFATKNVVDSTFCRIKVWFVASTLPKTPDICMMYPYRSTTFAMSKETHPSKSGDVKHPKFNNKKKISYEDKDFYQSVYYECNHLWCGNDAHFLR